MLFEGEKELPFTEPPLARTGSCNAPINKQEKNLYQETIFQFFSINMEIIHIYLPRDLVIA